MAQHPPGLSPATAAQFAGGERAAFDAVYAAHAQQVRGWVRRFFTAPFEREEAVQEVWLQVAKSASAYEVNRGPLGPWLRVLTANRCRELLRARGSRVEVPMDDENDAQWLDAQTESPEVASGRAQLRAALEAFARGLPPQEAQVLQRSWVEGLTVDEVAAQLKLSARQVKYLKLKVVTRASGDAGLRALLQGVG